MWKLAVLVWLVMGITFAGIGIMVVVAVPELYNQGMHLIPLAAGIGALVAVPCAWLVARQIYGTTVAR
jgi:hypothetical protein